MLFIQTLRKCSERAALGLQLALAQRRRHERLCGLDSAGFPQLWDLRCRFTGLRGCESGPRGISGMFELSEASGEAEQRCPNRGRFPWSSHTSRRSLFHLVTSLQMCVYMETRPLYPVTI
ncbi:hypothetical protein AOLI_G00089210 [Acnodon oligacanthus]